MVFVAVASAMVVGLAPMLPAQDAKTNAPAANLAQAGGSSTQPKSASAKAKAAPKVLSGAEIYSMHCARCHPERYPNERTSAQWKTIAMHMRIRANLPASHYRTLLKYLQENSGSGY